MNISTGFKNMLRNGNMKPGDLPIWILGLIPRGALDRTVCLDGQHLLQTGQRSDDQGDRVVPAPYCAG